VAAKAEWLVTKAPVANKYPADATRRRKRRCGPAQEDNPGNWQTNVRQVKAAGECIMLHDLASPVSTMPRGSVQVGAQVGRPRGKGAIPMSAGCDLKPRPVCRATPNHRAYRRADDIRIR